MARGFSATRGFGARETSVATALPEVKDEAPKPERSPEAVALAKSARERAVALEPKLTKMLMSLADKMGGKMSNLEFRLKSTESIARKIDKEVATGGATSREVAAREMGDIIRHTMTFGDKQYTEGLERTLDALKKDGYSVKVKNFWQSDDPYQGININIEKDGVKTELQFHTDESLRVKEQNHLDYERYRNLDTPKDEKATLFRKMTAISNKIPNPSNLAKLLTIGTLVLQTLD